MSFSLYERRCTDCGETWTDAPGHRGHGCVNADNQTGFHVDDHVLVDGIPGMVDSLTPEIVGVYFRGNFQTRYYPLAQVKPLVTA